MKNIKILCIGDSHTAGFPLFDPLYGGNSQSSYEYWFNLLVTRKFPNASFEINNRGICGQTSNQVLNRLEVNLTKVKYDLVIFWAGANDIALGYSVKTIWDNLWRAYFITREKSIAILIVTIPPMNWPGINSKISYLNEQIKKNSGFETYLCADVYTALVSKRNSTLNPLYDSGDGVHLSIDGYEQVGKEIFRKTTPFLTDILK
ncbi:MAG: GDSL-type esterase/lipase family protein [Promethearchaeota archaeon]